MYARDSEYVDARWQMKPLIKFLSSRGIIHIYVPRSRASCARRPRGIRKQRHVLASLSQAACHRHAWRVPQRDWDRPNPCRWWLACENRRRTPAIWPICILRNCRIFVRVIVFPLMETDRDVDKRISIDSLAHRLSNPSVLAIIIDTIYYSHVVIKRFRF